MTSPDWDNFRGDTTGVCLGCGYRWPMQPKVSVTDTPACPECGTATDTVLEETTSFDWDRNEALISARLEIEISGLRKKGGIPIGWLKDEIDKLLKVLIAADCDTHSKLSGAPASEYIVMRPDAARDARDALDGKRLRSREAPEPLPRPLVGCWSAHRHNLTERHRRRAIAPSRVNP